MRYPLGSRPLTLLAALVLVTSGMAGCIGALDDEDERFASLEAALDEGHTEAQPEEDLPLRLKLIEPAASEVPQGETNVTFALWNTNTEEAVTNAEVTLDAFMPMMNHGTAPETDPEHVRNGVYRGGTNLMMGGTWALFVNVTLSTGEEAHFAPQVKVAGGDNGGDHGGGHDDHDDHDDHDVGPTTRYDSYEDAKSAEGEVFEPEGNDTLRLKLLEPFPREGLEQGGTNVTVLFYDEETDEPITNGTATLDAMMPAMGHGTSPEEDPVHAAHGVWKGTTTPSMNGTWVLEIGLEPDDGEQRDWSIEVAVGNGTLDGDEPAFEPYEEVFEDDVSGADYDVNHTLDVKGANATIEMNGTLSGASPVDEVTVELYDVDEEKLGSFTLDSDTNESSLTVEEAPDAGEYTVRVQGTALDASYSVAVHVAPP